MATIKNMTVSELERRIYRLKCERDSFAGIAMNALGVERFERYQRLANRTSEKMWMLEEELERRVR